LIDDPIPNYWGEKPSVFCRDLFVPAISFPKARFEAFCLGYFENMQRLYAGEADDITEEIMHCMGGDFVSAPNFHNPTRVLRFLGCVLGGDDTSQITLSSRDLTWSLIILQLHGLSAQFLRNALQRFLDKDALLQTSLDFSDSMFLAVCDDTKWSREALLLSKYHEICRNRETTLSDELTLSSNAALASYMELFGDQPTDAWTDEFVTFWIQFLSGLSCYFDRNDQMRSMHTAQTAYVVMQHVKLGFLQKYRNLHFLRCSDAHRSWYWPTMKENMDAFIHSIAYRNTESISISRVLEEFDLTDLPGDNIPIHLNFDLIECDRNLLGNMIRYWSDSDGRDRARVLIPRIAPSVIRRLNLTAMELIQFLADRKDTCFYFGWRFRAPQEATIESGEDSTDKDAAAQNPPIGMRELAWTTDVLSRIIQAKANGAEFDFDEFAREFAWVADMFGNGWHTPFDRLGEGGFQVLVAAKADDKPGNSVLRAGCGMVVFEKIRGPDGAIQAQVQELLWPIPNEKSKTHHGGYAKA
jgi:hypothetical protein